MPRQSHYLGVVDLEVEGLSRHHLTDRFFELALIVVEGETQEHIIAGQDAMVYASSMRCGTFEDALFFKCPSRRVRGHGECITEVNTRLCSFQVGQHTRLCQS